MSTPIIKIWEMTTYLSRYLIFKHNDQTVRMIIGCPVWVHVIYNVNKDENPEYFVYMIVTDIVRNFGQLPTSRYSHL